MVRGRSFLDGVLHGLGYRFLEYRALDGSNKEDGRDLKKTKRWTKCDIRHTRL